MTGKEFKFTKERLQGLPVPEGEGRLTFRDKEVPGLELRVTSNGTKTFSWFRRVKGGSPERVTIGRFPEVNVQRARDEATKLNASRATGESPAAARRAHRRDMTFSELFDLYIERHARVHKKTWEEDKQRYEQYLAASLGRRKLSSISREEISQLHSRITLAGHAAVANRVLALVSSIFGRAVEWSIVASNPVKGIRRNREKSRDRFLGSDELPRFLDSMLAEPNETLRDFFLLLLLTGARRANVLSMAWCDLNLDSAVWRIPETKAGEPLIVPLTDQAMALLRRRRQADPNGTFVLPGTGRKGHLIDPKKAWKRIFDRDELAQIRVRLQAEGSSTNSETDFARVPGSDAVLEELLASARLRAEALRIDVSVCRLREARIHDLRRTHGSWQAMTGTSLQIIGKALGHKNLQTTTIYARLQTDPVREAMTKATDAMLTGIDLAALLNEQPERA